MGNIDARIDTDGVKKTIKKAEEAIENAVDRSADSAMNDTIHTGVRRVKRKDAIWNKEVLGSFEKFKRPSGYEIVNHADHAEVVNYGGRWTAAYPPADALVPWVLSNLTGWNPIEEEVLEDRDDDLDPGGGSGDDGGGPADSGGSIGWGDIDAMSKESGKQTGAGSTTYSYTPTAHDVDTNNMQGFPRPSSVELVEGIDYDNLETIRPVNADNYDVLSFAERQNFEDLLVDLHGDEGHEIIELLQSWEQGTWNSDARKYEAIIQELYDVDADLRAPEHPFDVDITDGQMDAFHDASIASQEFLLQHLADDNGRMKLHRGMRNVDSARFGAEMLENPNSSRWDHLSTVVENYSVDEITANEFSEGISVSTTVDVESDVVMANDHMLTATGESEIHVLGGEKFYSRSDVRIGEDGNINADDVIGKDPQTLNDEELRAIRNITHKIHSNNETVDNEEYLTSILNEWERRNGEDQYFQRVISQIKPQEVSGTIEFDEGIGHDPDTGEIKVWKGQEIRYMHDDDDGGHVESYTVDSWTWDPDLVVKTESGEELGADYVNTVMGTDGEIKEGLIDGDNWWALSDEERIEQLRTEIDSKPLDDPDGHFDANEDAWNLRENMKEVVADNLYDASKDDDTARRLIHHMDRIIGSDGAAARTQGDEHYSLLASPSTPKNTLYHEFGHGTMASNDVSTVDSRMANKWNAGEFSQQERPRWSFDENGLADPGAVDYYDSADHGDINSYLLGDQEDREWNPDTQFWENTDPYGFDREDPNSWFNVSEPHSRDPSDVETEDVTGQGVFDHDTMDQGDWVRLELENGAVYEGAYIQHSAREVDGEWVRVMEIQTEGPDANMDIQVDLTTGEIVMDSDFTAHKGSHDYTNLPSDEPRFNWEPEQSEPPKRLAEAANFAWWRQTQTIMNDEGGVPSRDTFIRSPYSSTNSHEVVSQTTELLQNSKSSETGEIQKAYWIHPYLIKEWLRNYDADPDAQAALNAIPDDELQQLL